MGEEQEQQDKPEEQPEQQELTVPEVEIDHLLGDLAEKMEDLNKKGKKRQE